MTKKEQNDRIETKDEIASLRLAEGKERIAQWRMVLPLHASLEAVALPPLRGCASCSRGSLKVKLTFLSCHPDSETRLDAKHSRKRAKWQRRKYFRTMIEVKFGIQANEKYQRYRIYEALYKELIFNEKIVQ